jgi:hypothetical protein
MKVNLLVPAARRDPGSFRDPDGFVFRRGDEIFRAVLPSAVPRYRQFVASGLADDLQSAGLLVPTVEVSDSRLDAEAGLPAGSLVLRHEAIAFANYPYEWTFDMLRDAALVQLEILERCLERNWILKDASAYNVQFQGVRPVFLDVLSFAPLADGEPWAGYNQFCRMMLYPLMLEAYKHIPFQPWLRSDLEGVDPVVFGRMFRGMERCRPGVLTHVTAQAYLQHKFSAADYSVRERVKSAGMCRDIIVCNVRGLKKLVLRLRPPRQPTAWSDYSRAHYQPNALAQKEDFVRESLVGRELGLVWDLGCNDGRFSRIAAEHATTVVAMDADAGSISQLYRELRRENSANILPLLMNIANPSPAQGWASRERQALAERGKPELTLALALIHHLVIAANVPLQALLEWFAGVTHELVIEFMSKDDAMVQRLLLNKDDTYTDYHREAFECYLRQDFIITRCAELPGGTRFLYHAISRCRSVAS